MQYIGYLCPIVSLVLGLGVSGLLAYFAIRTQRRSAVLAETPFSKVERLGRGPRQLCKVRGRVFAQEELIRSPLSRRDCVYYRFTVQEQRTHHSKHGAHTTWVNVVDDKQSIAVHLEDDTGAVSVPLDEAEVVLKSAQSQKSGMFNDPPERLRRLLSERYGRSTKGLLFNKSMRYTESVLEDGANVIVVGEADKDRNGMVFHKNEQVGLIVSDKSDEQITGHVGRKGVWLWVGSAAALLVSLVFTACTGFFAISWHGAADRFQAAVSTARAGVPLAQDAPRPVAQDAPRPVAQDAPKPQPAAPPVPARPPVVRPKDEPPLPKVPTRGGPMGPESFDQAIEWLRGFQPFNLIACGSLAKAEKIYPPRQAEVAGELEKLLNGRDKLVAGESIKALVVWATAEQVPSLLKALDSTNPFIRDGSLAALVRLKEPRAAEPVAKMLISFNTRAKAAQALITIGPPVEAEVRKYLTHDDQGVREEAKRILGKIGKTGQEDDFAAALAGLSDEKVGGRRKALTWFASAKADHPRRAEAAREMARLLEKGNALDKKPAAEALVTWATAEEVPTLVRVLRQERLGVFRKYIIQTLGQIKDKSAVPILVEQLGNPFDGGETEKALIAFGPSVEDEVVKVLDQKGFRERSAACRVLREVGTAKSLPALKAARAKAERERGTGPEVAKAAQEAITAIESR
ncbi:MAG TPA: GIDE domain-containing protein [Gemmataceae bacterium]|jgi:HEAT repeat protein